ncbi:hypothetical protein ABT095_14315 [Kitasatospora sp. NPDC002227]|uniref:hypothetical protein n=1 Tax=Kitasatospora sp. NPDC002227 TaxID=3154773 RepID=UPI00333163A5
MHADRVVARWMGGGTQSYVEGILHEDGGRELKPRATPHPDGDDLVAEWNSVQLTAGEVCVSFTGLRSWACQDVHP